ncbi:MAG: hypothetical protein QOG43_2993 [Actinomycetota bacterium]|jgi:YVTN family beta-propeller protein|nr:hypothetical protein [Actinomycetota bacterium]
MRRIASWWICLLAGASMAASMLVTARPAWSVSSAAPVASLITIADAPLSVLVTDNRDHAYASGPGRIEVLKISTGTLEAPIPLAFGPAGLDVSPDGSLLYVGDPAANAVAVVDVAQAVEVRRYDVGFAPRNLAVASNGTILVHGGNATSWLYLVQLDLVTGTVTDRGLITAGTAHPILTAQFLRSSRDHSRIVVFGGATSVYSAATDAFVEPRSFGFGSAPAALDGDGSTILFNPGTRVMNEHLDVVATIPQTGLWSGAGIAVDDAGAMAYRARGNTLEVLDLSLDRVTATIPILEPVDTWELAISSDGRTVVGLTAHGILVAPVAAAVPTPACTPSSPAPMVSGVCGRVADVVVGGHGLAYATNADRDQVEVVSLATGALQTPIPVGSQPRGLALSPDGGTLYVADWGSNEVSVVDISARQEVRRITVPRHPHPDWDGVFSIAVADNGTALLTTSLRGMYGGGRFLQLDLVVGTLRARPDFDLLAQQTEGPSIVKSSADHSLITGWTDFGTSAPSGFVTLYTSATDSISPRTYFPPGSTVAAAAGGSRVLALPGSTVYDRDMVVQGTIPGGGRAVAVNSSGTTGYRVQDGSIDVLDLAGLLQVGSIPLPEPVGSASGRVAITADGAKLAVLTSSGLSVVNAVSAAITPRSAYAVWSQPTAAALDAVGTWVVPANVPVAAGGQLPPSYLYAHYFNFTQSPSALGVVGLVTSAGTKLAAFGIVDGGGNSHSVGLPFDWLAGRAYYLFVAQLNPTAFGGWVYDYTAASWTFVGQVNLPVPLGRISPATVTQVIWFGPAGATCGAFPSTDAYFYPPVGYAGGATAQATMADSRTSAAGTCPAAATRELTPWIHLHLGASLA